MYTNIHTYIHIHIYIYTQDLGDNIRGRVLNTTPLNRDVDIGTDTDKQFSKVSSTVI